MTDDGSSIFLRNILNLTAATNSLVKPESDFARNPTALYTLLKNVLIHTVKNNFGKKKLIDIILSYDDVKEKFFNIINLNADDPQRESIHSELSGTFEKFLQCVNPFTQDMEPAIPTQEFEQLEEIANKLKISNEQFYEMLLNINHARKEPIRIKVTELEELKILVKGLTSSIVFYKKQQSERKECISSIKRNSELNELLILKEFNVKHNTDLKTLSLDNTDEVFIQIPKAELDEIEEMNKHLKESNELYQKQLKVYEKLLNIKQGDKIFIPKVNLDELKNMVNILKETNDHCVKQSSKCCHTNDLANLKKKVEDLERTKTSYELVLEELKSRCNDIESAFLLSQEQVALLREQQNYEIKEPFREIWRNFYSICELCTKTYYKNGSDYERSCYDMCEAYLENQRFELKYLNDIWRNKPGSSKCTA